MLHFESVNIFKNCSILKSGLFRPVGRSTHSRLHLPLEETCEMTIMDIFTCLGSFIKATTLKNVNTLKLRLEEER